jgi:hypothetical protein
MHLCHRLSDPLIDKQDARFYISDSGKQNIMITTGEGTVYINFKDPAKTSDLFSAILE